MTTTRGMRIALALAACSWMGCGDDSSSPGMDAGTRDSGAVDTGSPIDDAGPGTDAFVPGEDGGPPPEDSGPSGVLVSAAEGGLVTSEDGLFQIYVTPGALTADTRITIERVAD